jgi:hypothetical protein
VTNTIRVSRQQWLDCIAASDLPAVQKAVLLALAIHFKRRGDSAYPSLRRIAALTGLSFGYVGKVIKDLGRSGWLSVEPSKHRRRPGRPVNEYLATVSANHSGPILDTRFVASLEDTNGASEFVSSEAAFVSSMEDTEVSSSKIERGRFVDRGASVADSDADACVTRKVWQGSEGGGPPSAVVPWPGSHLAASRRGRS